MPTKTATATKKKATPSKKATGTKTPKSPKVKSPAKAAATKSPKTKETEAPPAKRAKVEAVPVAGGEGADADVVITSSKACQAFAKRANELEKLIKAAKPAASVFINTEKKISSNPDRGTFAVRVKEKTLVELKAMPRPFTAMKQLDINDLAKQVLAGL